MKTKHTLESWTLTKGKGDFLIRAGEKGFVIAEVSCKGISHFIGNEQEAKANAKLIEAAPELLQMVYDLKNCIKRLTEDEPSQFRRDTEAEWIGEAHELLTKINPDYHTNENTALKEDKKEITDVIFLIDKETNIIPNEIFAFFPKEHHHHKEHSLYDVMLTSYGHTGQHSACHIDYAKECKEAKPEQYADLKAELESLGYSLNVLSKKTIRKEGANV